MANFGQLVLTNVGIQEQYKAQGGNSLKFKRIGMGSGKYTGNIMALTKLVKEDVSVAVSNGYMQNNAYTIEGFFSNEGLQTGFAWREIGVFVEDASGNEVLYCYANAGDTYDYIPATTDERYSKYIRIAIAIGNATNVSIVENEGFLYVDMQTYKAAIEELSTNLDQLWPSKEVSSSSISVEDSANQPPVGLSIYGKSTQDGTPTPDAPVKIVSVETPVVDVYGKNLLKETDIPKTMTSSGITCDYEGGGVFHIYGTHTGAAQEVQLSGTNIYIPVDKEENYTLAVKLLEGTHPAKFHFFVGLMSNSVEFRNWFSVPLEEGNSNGQILYDARRPVDALGDATRISRFWIYNYNADLTAYTVNFRVQVWLEKGKVPTNYVPYTHQSMTITAPTTLPGIPVSSGGNYTDADGQHWICDEIDFERGVYIQRILMRTLTDFSVASNYMKSNGYTEANIWLHTEVLYTIGLCDRFAYAANGTKERFAALGNGAIYFVVKGELTLDEWKARMTELSPTVLLALKNPIETALTTEQIAAYQALLMHNPCTTILNDAGAGMKVKYVTKSHDDTVSAGRIFKGIIRLTEGVHYGDTLPAPGIPGRIFIKLVNS